MLDKIRNMLSGNRENIPESGGGETMYGKIESLDRVLEESRNRRVWILKHSIACPVSGRAKRLMDGFLESHRGETAYMVIVQQQRPLSNEIEERLNIRHETPQVLLVVDGEVRQFWSHYHIKQENLESELS